jgi:hypothetical protein
MFDAGSGSGLKRLPCVSTIVKSEAAGMFGVEELVAGLHAVRKTP